MSSPANEALAVRAGVKRVVLRCGGQAPAARQEHERAPWFRRGDRFRAGIAGRIRVLPQGFGLDRGREQGKAGLGRWGGWGILAHNRAQIAHTVARRPAPIAARAA